MVALLTQPVDGFVGVAKFWYKAFDGEDYSRDSENHSRATLVTINVTASDANQAPLAVTDSYSVRSGSLLDLTEDNGVLNNDTDSDGPNDLTAIRTSIVIGIEPIPDLLHGKFTFRSDGSFTYKSVDGFVGTARFWYKAFDGEDYSRTTLVTINVTASSSNQAPVAVADTYEIVNNSELNVLAASGVLANDTDSDHQALRAVLNTTVSNGVLTLNSDGSFNYNPTDGFVGNDVFTYRAFDGALYSGIVNVSVNVTAPSSGGGGGGGGGSVRNPRNASIVINNNAVSTNTVSVNLTLSADNMIATYAPLEMRISNFSNFNNASWRPYATTTSWTLLSGNGNKTVYAQFKNKRGVSSNVSDSIQLTGGQVLGDRDCSGIAGSLFSLLDRKDATVYYMGSDCKKYAFPDPKTYYTWYNDFSKVVKVTISELDLYLDGGVITYRPGIKLVKTVDTNRVYAVEPDGVLRHITSPAMARSLYGDNWQRLVQDVITGYFASTYSKGSSLNDLFPTGTLAKEPDNDTIYYIENGKKRPFSSLAAFNANYFRMKDVMIKNSLANYGVGDTIHRFDLSLLPYPLIN
jgi:hypothetical protein